MDARRSITPASGAPSAGGRRQQPGGQGSATSGYGVVGAGVQNVLQKSPSAPKKSRRAPSAKTVKQCWGPRPIVPQYLPSCVIQVPVAMRLGGVVLPRHKRAVGRRTAREIQCLSGLAFATSVAPRKARRQHRTLQPFTTRGGKRCVRPDVGLMRGRDARTTATGQARASWSPR